MNDYYSAHIDINELPSDEYENELDELTIAIIDEFGEDAENAEVV